MKPFLDENFLLHNKVAQVLYHEFAKDLPIIDYHNHLSPQLIVEDHNFSNLTEAWLHGDHYKWRAMRANGVDESYCTGEQADEEKFLKWAETVPYTLRNPLYHWTHLELQRYFNIDAQLNGNTAKGIYHHASKLLRQENFSVRNLLGQMKVEVVCTTDDPLDNLEYHKAYAEEDNKMKLLPTFRPDRFFNIDSQGFKVLIQQLSVLTEMEVDSFDTLLTALSWRAHEFALVGCKLADHGLEQVYAADFTVGQVNKIVEKALEGQALTIQEVLAYKSALLHHLGGLYARLGWTQQFHLGALRNNNSRAFKILGPDAGFDSIGDFTQAQSLAKFLGKLDEEGSLAKTVVYNLNPAYNEVIATMVGNFNDGKIAGKMQFGSGWWFLDQKDGMTKQINTLSNMGLLPRFVGMLTDSRSFLSFPRHEYFRRILCNIFGEDIENGELPADLDWTGQVIQNICYFNAKNYFNL